MIATTTCADRLELLAFYQKSDKLTSSLTDKETDKMFNPISSSTVPAVREAIRLIEAHATWDPRWMGICVRRADKKGLTGEAREIWALWGALCYISELADPNVGRVKEALAAAYRERGHWNG